MEIRSRLVARFPDVYPRQISRRQPELPLSFVVSDDAWGRVVLRGWPISLLVDRAVICKALLCEKNGITAVNMNQP